MSTHACFEKHKELANRHEEKVRILLEESSKALKPGPDRVVKAGGLSASAGSAGLACKAVREAVAQQRLAVREYREASRLRPRDTETQQRLRAASLALRSLQDALDGPKPRPLRRFLAHYNLSIRYWDLGKAKQAIAEADRACQELRKVGLPCGCAEHNLLLMMQVHAEYRGEHRRLLDVLERSPEALHPNYELGIHFFDKRQLARAEAQLRFTRERARAVSALQLVEHDRQKLQASSGPADALACPAQDGKKAGRMIQLLEDVEDDLDFVAGLRQLWCVEEDAGKSEELQATGLRDGSRPHLLPCLHRRYSQDTGTCDAWWAQLCTSTDISLYAEAPRRTQAPARRQRPPSAAKPFLVC